MKGYAIITAGLIGPLLLAGGCGTVDTRLTVEQMTNARVAVESASKAGAKTHAPDTLRQAQDALAIASDAYANQAFDRAFDFGKKAITYALVAQARSEQKTAEQKLADIRAQSVQVQAQIKSYMQPAAKPQIAPAAPTSVPRSAPKTEKGSRP